MKIIDSPEAMARVLSSPTPCSNHFLDMLSLYPAAVRDRVHFV